MPGPRPSARGLSAAELGAATGELRALLDAALLEALPLRTAAGHEDLLLVLQPRGNGPKTFVHVALGSSRARVATTTRRFPKSERVRGPAADLLLRELADATFAQIEHPAGERRCELGFLGPHGPRRLVVELFGSRGLWALLDDRGRALALSRTVETAVRTLRPGDLYAAPPPTGDAPRDEPSGRFAAPVLPAIDAWFQTVDAALEFTAEHERLRLACQRALQRARTKAAGLQKGLADTGRAAELRSCADLMLAFAGTVARGAAEMVVPDPAQDGAVRRIELDPARPVVQQAQQLYEKARRLDDGRAIAERRLAEAEATAAALQAIAQQLEDAGAAADAAALDAPRAELQRLGAMPRSATTTGPTTRAPKPTIPREENYRRFVSAEGYPILVGRDNTQNDRLTMRTANGNDLWLHVGGGRAGSHVVVRLPKHKTASLETLLDAATLAVHFSKARGEARIDVIYTLRKHVRKPKGLPPGAVVPSQTKTIGVRADAARLQRLLDGAGGESD